MSIAVERSPSRQKISVDEYYRMAEDGRLAPDARVELIEGVIVPMAPIGPEHCGVTDQLASLFMRACDRRAIVRVQGAIRLSNWTEPEPDLALLKPRDDYYRKQHPSGADILLVVEVSESSLRYDRHTKVPLYARYGVPEVWIVNLQNREVHFYGARTESGYAEVSSERDPKRMALRELPGVGIDLSSILEN
jgi:Uma2 family endonuclease